MQLKFTSPQTTVLTVMLELVLISIALLLAIMIFYIRKKISSIDNLFVDPKEDPEFSKHIMTNVEVDYPIKQIQITIRRQFYKKLKLQKPELYNKIPENGFSFDIEYADTGYLSDNNQTDTIVLALHGAPGSHHDFASLIEHLSKSARVIAPNFPDYSATIRTEVFRHSAEEKAAYIKEFLNTIKIHKIDMLLVHSSAIYPSVLLWLDSYGPQINSFAFFNPGGHRRVKAMKPSWFIEGGVRFYQNKFGRALYRNCGTAFLNLTKSVRAKTDDIEAIIHAASAMMYSGYRQFEEKLEKLGQSKLPILFVFSENDRLIEKEIFYEMVDILGADGHCITKYNEYGILENQYSHTTNNIKVMAFKSGGHYAFMKYAKQIRVACDQLLRTSLNNHCCDKQ